MGGVIMMVEQSLTLVIALVVLFMGMLVRSEAEERRRERLEERAGTLCDGRAERSALPLQHRAVLDLARALHPHAAAHHDAGAEAHVALHRRAGRTPPARAGRRRSGAPGPARSL